MGIELVLKQKSGRALERASGPISQERRLERWGREGLTSGLAVFRRSCTRIVESNEAESISVPSSEKSSWLMAVA